MLDDVLKRTILDAVDAGFDEQIRFTQELVRLPSLRGQEHTAQDVMYEAMASRGLAMDRWTTDVDAIKDHPGHRPSHCSSRNGAASPRPRAL